jgi:hypothetical protein
MSTAGKSSKVKFGSNSIWTLDAHPDVPYWTCPLHVDADGSPRAYHPATPQASSGSPPGLDYLANAGKPGNWWGIACDSNGKPFIQKSTDLCPGFYVSTTALIDSGHPVSSPLRYINSELIPFIVLPSSPKFHPKQKLGDLCMCFNNDTGKYSWAIYADVGPANQIGEGSMALCKALGLSDSPKTGGTDKEIIAMVLFAGTGSWPNPPHQLTEAAYKLWEAWGGYTSAQYAMPQFNWDQFPPIPPEPILASSS